MSELVSAEAFEQKAKRRLEPSTYSFYAGGAGAETTLEDNLAAFRRWYLRPRVLADVGQVTTTIQVLATEVALPVLLAPVAFQSLAQPQGELAAARAAAAAGTIYCLPTISGVSPGECAQAAPPGQCWFQLYWSRDRGFTRELLERVAEAGFSALLLTVDLPVFGHRDRERRSGFAFPAGVPLPNVSPELLPLGSGHGHMVDPTLTWRDLEWLQETARLPLVLKGAEGAGARRPRRPDRTGLHLGARGRG
ncbi:MAG TPA: alpha-hydroxy acid oxidase [Gaiellaceae bacterium]